MSGRSIRASDGTPLYVDVKGEDGAPALVLCNSLGTDVGLWDPQMPAWRGFRVVRFDQRGHGRSAAPAGPYSVERLGLDVVEVMDAVALDGAHLCGLSLGGLVALWVAAHRPERVRHLILADTAAKIGTANGWRERAAAVRAGGTTAVVDEVLPRFFSDRFLAAGDPLLEQTTATLRGTDAEGYAASCEALAGADLRGDVGSVAADALVVVGSEDRATPPAEVRELAEALPRASLVTLEGAGHLANLERPREFARLVADFLRA